MSRYGQLQDELAETQAEAKRLREALERIVELAAAATPGLLAPPTDCMNACYFGACDCSGKCRPVEWDLDPEAVTRVARAALIAWRG